MEVAEILRKLRQIQKEGISEAESERMLQALLDIGARLADTDEEDMSQAEKHIVSCLESVVD